MSVPKSRRNLSKMEFYHQAYLLRREVTTLLLYEDRMTYVTWDECPQGTGIGAECGEQKPGEPSQIELMQAQLDYTAIMTDTLLEMEA